LINLDKKLSQDQELLIKPHIYAVLFGSRVKILWGIEGKALKAFLYRNKKSIAYYGNTFFNINMYQNIYTCFSLTFISADNIMN